jgi:hypothetical protein
MRSVTLTSPDMLLPDVSLIRRGLCTAAARAQGCHTYREAASFVWRLPYGRTSSRADLGLVLKEGQGTCSSKHGFLKALAVEQRLRIGLVLGFFEMTEANTPGVGPVLEAHGVASVLEAHCFLAVHGHSIDLTMPPGSPAGVNRRFLHREFISASQVGAYKVERHRQAMADWVRTLPAPRSTPAEMWAIREACIARLGEAPQPRRLRRLTG